MTSAKNKIKIWSKLLKQSKTLSSQSNFNLISLLNEWIIYIVLLLCIAIHLKRFTIMWGGVSPQPPPVCSIHLDDATAATGQWRQCAHHTPATDGEERESYRANQVDGDYWEDSGGNLARTPGMHPYSFTISVMGFLMTTESQWVYCTFSTDF